MRVAKSLIVILSVVLLLMTASNIYWFRKYHRLEQMIVEMVRVG